MKNKNYYIAVSSVVIVIQSLSLWHAGKSRLEKVQAPIQREVTFEPRKATFEKKRGLEQAISGGEPKKFDLRQTPSESTPVMKKKADKNTGKKTDSRAGETFKLPSHLYLVISSKTWQESKNQKTLPEKEYVHFWKEEQLKEIGEEQDFDHIYIVLKVATERIEGKWVFKAAKDGEEKFFFLYKGVIPTACVIEAKTILKGF